MNTSIPSATSLTRLPSIPESGTSRAAAGTVAQATATAASSASRSTEASTDTSALATPKPLRFPWLSRLSEQLATAAKQKPAFPSAPVLGDNVDQRA